MRMGSFPSDSILIQPAAFGEPVFSIAEYCGINHALQVVEIAPQVELPVVFALESEDGRLFFGQRSHSNHGVVYLQMALRPFERLVLKLSAKTGELDGVPARFQLGSEGKGFISNGFFSLEVLMGVSETPGSVGASLCPAGPLCRFRIGSGPWRGRTFIDSRRRAQRIAGEILVEGPLRIVYRYRAELEPGGFYQATITVDAGQSFAKIEEEFQGGSGDQIVWDFSGADLPEEFYALDSSAAFSTRPLAYHLDGRVARLAAWTQQSQLLDLVDGFAIGLGQSSEVAGFVTLEGGSWRGARLNQLEAWGRRWIPGDPASRRDIPATAKADSYPGPERIPARGGVLCEEHFNVEGWIGNGRRKFALVLTQRVAIQPANAFSEPALGHFEQKPDRERYQRQQSLLRRIHIQHGVMPLQEILHLEFSWPEEPALDPVPKSFLYPNDVLDQHFPGPRQEPRAEAEAMLDYLAARVYGFWEGSGLAYTNPVSSRRIAPELFRYEWLMREGTLRVGERTLARAHFAFLIHLFSSENCYPGDAAMLPRESPDSTEPTLAGMANQNFHTDIFNLLGAGAQVLFEHPRAQVWRSRFIEQWHRQLAFHIYPESGLWEESHTYYEHVLHTILPTLLRRRADGVDDEFANKAFQNMVAAALKQVAPRDACFANRRYLVAFGDHEPAPSPKRFQALAKAFADVNPLLSRQLAWLAREMGCEEAVVVEPPQWSSEQVQGLGVMFRGVDSSGQESLLALRSGQTWGHHHNDDGSIQFFAKGRSLIVDSAFAMSQAGGYKVDAAGHSRWSLRDLSPVNHFWRFNRGWITDFDLLGRFPSACSFSPVHTVRGGSVPNESLSHPIWHWRSVVQLDAATYLIVDSSQCDLPQVVGFHLAGRAIQEDADRAILDFPGGRLAVIPVLTRTTLALGLNHSDGQRKQGDYTTTSACYDIGLLPFAAFLIRAGDPGERIELTAAGSVCAVRAAGLDVEIRVLTPNLLQLTDGRSGHSNTIDLHTYVTH